MTAETERWAPDFGRNGTPYPSRGRLVGPAWSYAWHYLGLGEGAIISRKSLADLMAFHTGVATRTAENLLRRATEAGLLLVHHRGTLRVPFLVRADLYYTRFPDEAPEGYQPPRPPEVSPS